MAQFVCQHAFEFFVVEQAKNALCHRHRRVRRITPSGEGVRRVVRNHVDLRHGQANALRHALYHVIDARQFFAGHRLRTVHRESNLVGKEIAYEIAYSGNGKANRHAMLSS